MDSLNARRPARHCSLEGHNPPVYQKEQEPCQKKETPINFELYEQFFKLFNADQLLILAPRQRIDVPSSCGDNMSMVMHRVVTRLQVLVAELKTDRCRKANDGFKPTTIHDDDKPIRHWFDPTALRELSKSIGEFKIYNRSVTVFTASDVQRWLTGSA